MESVNLPTPLPTDDLASTTLAALWQRHRTTNLARLVLLEDAAVAVLLDRLDPGTRERAIDAAHKLCGSLITFGFDAASQSASAAEAMLRGGAVNGKQFADSVAAIRALLEQDASTANSVGAQADAPSIENITPDDDTPSGPAAGDIGVGSILPAAPRTGPRLLLLSADAELSAQLGVAAAAAGAELDMVTSPAQMREQLTTAMMARPFAAVLVDLDPYDDQRPDSQHDPPFAPPQPTAPQEVADAQLPSPFLIDEVVAARRFVLTDAADLGRRIELLRRGVSALLPRTQRAAHTINQVLHTLAATASMPQTVLVVGAQPRTIVHASDLLRSNGSSVVIAVDGLQAWAMIERDRPDLMLLDLDVPGMHGLDLIRLLRADSRYRTLPVLAITASAASPRGAAALERGADDVIARTALNEELITRVRVIAERVQYLRTVANSDESTGVDNRNAAARELDRLTQLALRRSDRLAVVILRIDEIAAVRSRHGDVVGDVVQRRLAQLLTEEFRGEDMVARWGPEEFMVVLYGATSEAAANRLRTIGARLASLRFAGTGSTITVSFSAGVAELVVDGVTPDKLCDAAHLALEQAARVGGQVQVCGAREAVEILDVVLVEDDESLAHVVSNALDLQGLTYRWISDGADAAMLLGGGTLRTRVVLLDIGLPGMDGFGILHRLRETGVLRRTKVIVVTARSGESETLRALGLGAVDHVAKPFSLPVLMQRLAVQLGQVT